MITFSTIANNSSPVGKTVSLTVPLKSRWPGDENTIRYVSIRAPKYQGAGEIDTHGAPEARSTAIVASDVEWRPPLFHSQSSGLTVRPGIGNLILTPQSPFRAVAMMIKPNSTLTISVGNGTTATASIPVTLQAAANTYRFTFAGPTVYLNGSSVTTNVDTLVPFPRLLFIDFGSDVTDLRIGNAYTDTTSATPSFQVDHVSFLKKVVGTTSTAFTSTEAGLFADMFYRRPTAVDASSNAIGGISDTIVPNPESWPVVSSS